MANSAIYTTLSCQSSYCAVAKIPFQITHSDAKGDCETFITTDKTKIFLLFSKQDTVIIR